MNTYCRFRALKPGSPTTARYPRSLNPYNISDTSCRMLVNESSINNTSLIPWKKGEEMSAHINGSGMNPSSLLWNCNAV